MADTLEQGISAACERAARDRSGTFAVYVGTDGAIFVRDARAARPADARLECKVSFWGEHQTADGRTRVEVQIRRAGASSEWREV